MSGMIPFGGKIGYAEPDNSYSGVWSLRGVCQRQRDAAWIIDSPPLEVLGYQSGTGTVSIPAGAAENDLVFVLSYNDTSTPTLPSGYQGYTGNTNSVGYMYGYKHMGATPDTTVSIASADCGLVILVRGVNETTVIDTTLPTLSSGASGMPDPPSVTPVNNGCLIFALGWLDDDTIGEPTPPSGFTFCGYGSAGGAVMAAYLIQETAGAIDPAAFSSGTGTDSWLGQTVPIRPAGV